jgi:hypothetical protein
MSVLRAGGFPVHRVRVPAAQDPEQKKGGDAAPIFERYQDLAAAMHRTFIAPRGTMFLWGCSCGRAEISREAGARYADLAAMKHVLDKATELYENLEGKPMTLEGDNP